MLDIKVVRAKFYERMMKQYNTSKEEIVRIIKNNNYEIFKETEIPEYEFCISAWFKALEEEKEEKLKETVKHAGDWRKTIFPTKESYPCPILGCTGVKVFNKGNSKHWVCSAGGQGHYGAMAMAKKWKADIGRKESIEELAAMIVGLKEYVSVEEKEETTV